jgi:hypothetical protein
VTQDAAGPARVAERARIAEKAIAVRSVHAKKGHAKKGHAKKGRVERARVKKGRVERARVKKGRVERARVKKGRVERAGVNRARVAAFLGAVAPIVTEETVTSVAPASHVRRGRGSKGASGPAATKASVRLTVTQTGRDAKVGPSARFRRLLPSRRMWSRESSTAPFVTSSAPSRRTWLSLSLATS